MIFAIKRQFQDQVIRIPVRTGRPEMLVIKVYHSIKPYTFYFNTNASMNGIDAFTVKIPKAPKEVYIELYNESNGHLDNDPTFKMGNISVTHLVPKFAINKIMDANVNSFAAFSDKFAENAGILSAQNSIYVSPNGKFTINYLDVIRDLDGTELTTPARINSKTRIIEIAKKYYINFTVPGRKAINWHEFSHMWRNYNQADEVEADKNAIMIYLGMGNPTVEAFNVFLKVFKNRPSDANVNRYKEIHHFITNFDAIMQKQLN